MANGKSNHHYVLAHVALRKICESDPLAFFGVMASPQRDDFLADAWRKVCKICDGNGKPSFSINDVTVNPCGIKEFPCLLITMPPPANVADAHFVGIVLKLTLDQTPPTTPPEILYVTLEKGVDQDGSPRTVLCRWEGDTHSNYGDGPPVDLHQFAAAIENMIK